MRRYLALLPLYDTSIYQKLEDLVVVDMNSLRTQPFQMPYAHT